MSDAHQGNGDARPVVEIDGQSIELQPDESVLEGLERSGVEVPSGCRAGTCCKCMLQGESPPPESQRTLRPTLREQGYFLSCQAKPTGRLKVLDREGSPWIGATIDALESVAPDVIRILLRPSVNFTYRPGQYLDVLHPSGASRSYSIASLPRDGVLELHVRLVKDGLVSGWLESRSPGDTLQLRGAYGQCFHVPGEDSKKLLLIGAGTGLAPLLGIARDALEQGHSGPVDLIHGGLEPGRLYLRDQLAKLATEWPSLRVHHCVLQGATKKEHEGRLDEVAIRLAGPLENTRAFLCGDPGIVRLLQRSLFMAGLPSAEILADPFEAQVSP